LKDSIKSVHLQNQPDFCRNTYYNMLKVFKEEKSAFLKEIPKLSLWTVIQYFSLEYKRVLNKKQLSHTECKYKCRQSKNFWKDNKTELKKQTYQQFLTFKFHRHFSFEKRTSNIKY
jgi:hypothetical protein